MASTFVQRWLLIILSFACVVTAFAFGFVSTRQLLNQWATQTEQNLAKTAVTKQHKPTTVCPELSTYNYVISASNAPGWCRVRVNYDWEGDIGYSLDYPNNLTFSLVGAAGTNASFLSEDQELISILVTHTQISSDKFVSLGHGIEPSEQIPVIGPEHEIIKTDTTVIIGRPVVYIQTQLEEMTYTFYFFEQALSSEVKTAKAVYVLRAHGLLSAAGIEHIVSSFNPEQPASGLTTH